jgi:hypothetical protein
MERQDIVPVDLGRGRVIPRDSDGTGPEESAVSRYT